REVARPDAAVRPHAVLRRAAVRSGAARHYCERPTILPIHARPAPAAGSGGNRARFQRKRCALVVPARLPPHTAANQPPVAQRAAAVAPRQLAAVAERTLVAPGCAPGLRRPVAVWAPAVLPVGQRAQARRVWRRAPPLQPYVPAATP